MNPTPGGCSNIVLGHGSGRILGERALFLQLLAKSGTIFQFQETRPAFNGSQIGRFIGPFNQYTGVLFPGQALLNTLAGDVSNGGFECQLSTFGLVHGG